MNNRDARRFEKALHSISAALTILNGPFADTDTTLYANAAYAEIATGSRILNQHLTQWQNTDNQST